MKPAVHFLIGRHPLDLLRLAVKTLPAAERAPLICMTEGADMASMALGQRSSEDYPGLAAIIAGDLASVVRRVVCEGREVDVIFPSSARFDPSSRAELIDRALHSINADTVVVLIDPSRIDEDLPPLSETDRIQCFWEVRDPLEERSVGWFASLQARLEHQPSRFLGLQLYGRDATTVQRYSEDCESIKDLSGLVTSDDVLVLDDEAISHSPAVAPHPLEMLGMLTRKVIHDFGNHVTCISGNVLVAQRTAGTDRDLCSTLLQEIRASAEKVGEFLNRLRETREALTLPEVKHTPEAVAASVRSLAGPLWTVTLQKAVPGFVSGDLRWLAFSIRTLCLDGSGGGSIPFVVRADAPLRGEWVAEGTSPRAFPVLEIIGAEPTSSASFALEASEEFIRSTGGWVSRENGAVKVYIPIQSNP